METTGICIDALGQNVESLYQDNHRWLRGWLRAKMGSRADAEDLVQETFIRMLGGQPGARLVLREPRAYLATIAGRLLANFYRRLSIERAYLEVLATIPEDQVPSLETQALVRETLLEIDQMLDGLGKKVKQAFLLAQFEELPYAQIAERLGISLRTAKNYVARAIVHCCIYRQEMPAGVNACPHEETR